MLIRNEWASFFEYEARHVTDDTFLNPVRMRLQREARPRRPGHCQIITLEEKRRQIVRKIAMLL